MPLQLQDPTALPGLAVPQAVVDELGKVHGTDNIYVADASVIPTIPRANTNLPTLVIAERIVECLR